MADWTHRTSVNTLGEELEHTQIVERKKIVGKNIKNLNDTWLLSESPPYLCLCPKEGKEEGKLSRSHLKEIMAENFPAVKKGEIYSIFWHISKREGSNR